MTAILTLLVTALLASLALVGMAIGVFYRRKFGEATRSWLLGLGAGLGMLGQGLTLVPGIPSLVGDLVCLAGAAALAAGTFWLWFVMLGPKQ